MNINIATNPLEKNIQSLHDGQMEIDDFMHALISQSVFLPVADEKETVGGFQKEKEAVPLIVEVENNGQSQRVIPVFSDPAKSKEFMTQFPGFSGGLLVEIAWIIKRLSPDMGLSINPNFDRGLDLDQETIQQLVTLLHRGKS